MNENNELSKTIAEGSVVITQPGRRATGNWVQYTTCLLYTSDAADERSSVDLGGRRIIKKKNNVELGLTGII